MGRGISSAIRGMRTDITLWLPETVEGYFCLRGLKGKLNW